VVVDVSNSPSWEDAAVLKFFETSTRNLLTYEAAAGVGHHVALSVVGTDRLSESGYFRAKIAQEKLIKQSSIPYTIVHATQFFEFLKGLADISMVGDKVHLPPVLFQPMAADDVASGVARVAVGQPVNGIVEIGGPEQFRVDELVRRRLASLKDPREVIADPNARYDGAKVSEKTLFRNLADSVRRDRPRRVNRAERRPHRRLAACRTAVMSFIQPRLEFQARHASHTNIRDQTCSALLLAGV
jgi:uncharacterized protein YbjT (DUF2867 family)